MQRQLRLTTEQIAAIDRIFHANVSERRRLARHQEALEAQLAAALLEGNSDESAISSLAERVVRARARRNVSRTLLLLRMYRVLTVEQRRRLKRTLQEPGR